MDFECSFLMLRPPAFGNCIQSPFTVSLYLISLSLFFGSGQLANVAHRHRKLAHIGGAKHVINGWRRVATRENEYQYDLGLNGGVRGIAPGSPKNFSQTEA